jgi:hypothetical protein
MQFLGTGPTGGWGVDVSPLLRHPRGHLACMGVGLSLRPSARLPRSLPFPRSREGGVGGGGFGGGSGSAGASWRPSTDRHAFRESRSIPLIFVKNDREEFCLGCIGDDEYRFCRSTACNIVKHKKRRYDLGCQEGYYISVVFAKSSRATQAFRTPFLDASKLTPEVRAVVTYTRDQGLKTTIEWEEFIMQAQLAWHASLKAARRKGQGSGISKGSNKDNVSSESMVSLIDEPFRKSQIRSRWRGWGR